MKPVGANDEIKAPLAGMLEFNIDLAIRLAQIRDIVAEDDLARPADPVIEELRETAAPDGDISTAGELAEYTHAKS